MKIKRFWVLAACMIAVAVSAGETAPAQEENCNLRNMGRGVVNIVTCALEIPRCMVYRNSEMPFWGLIAGAVDGAGCTAMRAVTGVTDILFLGFDYGTAFNQCFRTYVWESRWLPPTPVKGKK
jgi:putative exosortase-associated protein (TIGR04073 family)